MNTAAMDPGTKPAHALPLAPSGEVLLPKGKRPALGRSGVVDATAATVEERAGGLVHSQDDMSVLELGEFGEKLLAGKPQERPQLIHIFRFEVDVRVIVVIRTAGPALRLALEA
jgi:hypothetical protein